MLYALLLSGVERAENRVERRALIAENDEVGAGAERSAERSA